MKSFKIIYFLACAIWLLLTPSFGAEPPQQPFFEQVKDFFSNHTEPKRTLQCPFTVVRPQDYVINFVWLNKDLDLEQTFLNTSDEKKYQTDLINPLVSWHKMNPGTKMNVWYDGRTTGKRKITQLHESIKQLGATTNIRFRNIQDLASVKNHQQLFDDVKVSVYFKADIVRLMILEELAKLPDSPRFIIYSDLNIPAIGLEKNEKKRTLFDPETLMKLSLLGMVVSSNAAFDSRPWENAFYIIDKTNTKILDLINSELIEESIKDYSQGKHEQIVWTNHLYLFKKYLKYIGLIFDVEGASNTRKYLNSKRYAGKKTIVLREVICPGNSKEITQFFIQKEALSKEEPGSIFDYLILNDILYTTIFTKNVDKPKSKFYGHG